MNLPALSVLTCRVDGGVARIGLNRPDVRNAINQQVGQAILESAGSSLAGVVKTTIFLRDMNDFGAMNEIYGSYFQEDPPARSTVQVAKLPRDGAVEIEAVALVK